MKMEIAAWFLSGSTKRPNINGIISFPVRKPCHNFPLLTSNSEGDTQQENGGLSVGQHGVFVC